MPAPVIAAAAAGAAPAAAGGATAAGAGATAGAGAGATTGAGATAGSSATATNAASASKMGAQPAANAPGSTPNPASQKPSPETTNKSKLDEMSDQLKDQQKNQSKQQDKPEQKAEKPKAEESSADFKDVFTAMAKGVTELAKTVKDAASGSYGKILGKTGVDGNGQMPFAKMGEAVKSGKGMSDGMSTAKAPSPMNMASGPKQSAIKPDELMSKLKGPTPGGSGPGKMPMPRPGMGIGAAA